MVRLGAVVLDRQQRCRVLLGRSAKRKRPGDESRPLSNEADAAIKGRGRTLGPHIENFPRKLPKQKTVHVFLGALSYSVLTPNHETKSPLARLAVMEFEVGPHEAYDAAISTVFVVAMLIVTVLIFVVLS